MNITSRHGIGAGKRCQKSHLAGSSPSRRGSRGVYRPCVQDTHPKVWSHGIEINRHTVEFSSNRRPDQSTPELAFRSAPTRRCRVLLLFYRLLCFFVFLVLLASELISSSAFSQFLAICFPASGITSRLRCSRLYRNLRAASKSAVPGDFTATFRSDAERPRHGRRPGGVDCLCLRALAEDHPE